MAAAQAAVAAMASPEKQGPRVEAAVQSAAASPAPHAARFGGDGMLQPQHKLGEEIVKLARLRQQYDDTARYACLA